MKLIKKDIEKDGQGEFTLLPEEPQDMWHTYNLIMVGVRASTIR
jgi:protein pelota